MRKGSTLFLRLVIVLLGLSALAFCALVLPRVIGAIDAWGYDPILLGMYIPALPFFIALYQSLKLLGLIDKEQAFSLGSVNCLRIIKYCAGTVSVMYALGMPYIFYVADQDDAPGVVLIALIIIFSSFVIAVFAAVLQSLLQSALEIKSENDLTV